MGSHLFSDECVGGQWEENLNKSKNFSRVKGERLRRNSINTKGLTPCLPMESLSCNDFLHNTYQMMVFSQKFCPKESEAVWIGFQKHVCDCRAIAKLPRILSCHSFCPSMYTNRPASGFSNVFESSAKHTGLEKSQHAILRLKCNLCLHHMGNS